MEKDLTENQNTINKRIEELLMYKEYLIKFHKEAETELLHEQELRILKFKNYQQEKFRQKYLKLTNML